jgi:hypothetical protein
VVELTTGEVIFFVFIRDVAFSTHLHSGFNRKGVSWKPLLTTTATNTLS